MNSRYELHNLSQDCAVEVPTISGCFLLARSAELMAVDGFDPRYFMYLEDVDLVRRLASRGAVKYLPTISVVHDYAKGSYSSIRLLSYHIISAIKYFNKWGWVFDSKRSAVNLKILTSLAKR